MSSSLHRTTNRTPNGYPDERARLPAAQGAFKAERVGIRKAPSPQPIGGLASTSHKRTASGNPRPAGTTATEERRHEERRVTERTYEAQLDRLIPRPGSPLRTQKKLEKRPVELSRHKSSETKAREPRSETPQVRSLPRYTRHT